MYTALSEVYDLFYGNDSAARADYYRKFLPQSGEGIDIGCGTGALTLEFYKRGYKMLGEDSSMQMLNKATERAVKNGADIKFVCAGAENPLYTHKLDFAIAANDVFNYVNNIGKAFKAIYGLLKDGGVFAFDISSEYKLKNVLAGNTFSETEQDTTYIWKNYLKSNKLIIDFTVFMPHGESYIKSCETQVQHVRKTEDIISALRAAGFKNVKAYGFYKLAKPKPDALRIAFAATK